MLRKRCYLINNIWKLLTEDLVLILLLIINIDIISHLVALEVGLVLDNFGESLNYSNIRKITWYNTYTIRAKFKILQA